MPPPEAGRWRGQRRGHRNRGAVRHGANGRRGRPGAPTGDSTGQRASVHQPLLGGDVRHAELRHERIPPAPPNQNAPSESWHSLLERECLGNESCGDFPDAYRTVTAWIHHYNTVRYHGSLPDWPPAEGYRRAFAGTLTLKPSQARGCRATTPDIGVRTQPSSLACAPCPDGTLACHSLLARMQTSHVWCFAAPALGLVHSRTSKGVETMCDPTTERPWPRALRIDDAADHVSVAKAVEHGALAVLEVTAGRCWPLALPDATVSEVLQGWIAGQAT